MDVYLLVEILLGLINLIICFSFENFMDHSKTTLSRIVGEEEGGGGAKTTTTTTTTKTKTKTKRQGKRDLQGW